MLNALLKVRGCVQTFPLSNLKVDSYCHVHYSGICIDQSSREHIVNQNRSEYMCGNLALHNLLSSGFSAVNGCRQNESSNGWQKQQNNPQVIDMTSVHQLTSCEVKNCVVVRNCIGLSCSSCVPVFCVWSLSLCSLFVDWFPWLSSPVYI